MANKDIKYIKKNELPATKENLYKRCPYLEIPKDEKLEDEQNEMRFRVEARIEINRMGKNLRRRGWNVRIKRWKIRKSDLL